MSRSKRGDDAPLTNALRGQASAEGGRSPAINHDERRAETNSGADKLRDVGGGDSSDVIAVSNPADGSVVGTVVDMTASAVSQLAQQLRAAQPEWEDLGFTARASILRDWLDWIVDNSESLLALVHVEAGKSWGDTQIELMVCMEAINYYTKHGATFLADQIRRPHTLASAGKTLEIRYRPYQLVGVITPWNYPLAMPMIDIPQALLAGAAVLSKPSEETPLAWAECVRGWNEDIGAPAVLGCATGGPTAGSAVVDAVDMVQFTGSTATGRHIGMRCAQRLIPASLELGGKDAMIVLSDAPIARAARGAVWGGLFNSGQTCISVERIYVEEPVYQHFTDRLVEEVDKIRQGHDASGAFTADLGALANEKQMSIVEHQVTDAREKGARVLIGGRRACNGLFYPPTVLVDVDHTMACMQEETFGPLLPVMKVADEEQAINFANDSRYGLSGSVWTTSTQRAARVGRRLESGAVNINNVMANAFQFPLPMGGWKESGLGHRLGGAGGIRKYCREQAVVSEKLALPTEPYWYPHSPAKGRITRAVLRLTEMHDWRRRLGMRPR